MDLRELAGIALLLISIAAIVGGFWAASYYSPVRRAEREREKACRDARMQQERWAAEPAE